MSAMGFGYGTVNPPSNNGPSYWTVADSAARLALTVAPGDVGKRAYQSDLRRNFILIDDSPMIWSEEEAGDISQWRYYIGAAASPSNVGFATTGTGTLASATPANTDAGTMMTRTNYNSVAAINQVLNLRSTTPFNANGGIRCIIEATLPAVAANQRWGFGIGLSTAALVGTGAMNTNVDCFFFGRDAGENVHLYNNDNAGNCDKTDLGGNFPGATASSRYLIEIYTMDGSVWVGNCLNVANRAEASFSVSSNIPTIASNYAWQLFGYTNSDASALTFGIGSVKMANINRF